MELKKPNPEPKEVTKKIVVELRDWQFLIRQNQEYRDIISQMKKLVRGITG